MKKKPGAIEVEVTRIEEGEPLPTGPEVISQGPNDALAEQPGEDLLEDGPIVARLGDSEISEKARVVLDNLVDGFGRKIKNPLLRALWIGAGKECARQVTTPPVPARKRRRPRR